MERMERMERIEKILKNPSFIENLNKNKLCEKERIFCRHGIEHLLDTARIAYIYNFENNLNFPKDIIYAASLLHDIGKWQQYENNIPHNEASAYLAKDILTNSNFNCDEIEIILSAIMTHSNYKNKDNTLNYILFMADKKSRNCFLCDANSKCS